MKRFLCLAFMLSILSASCSKAVKYGKDQIIDKIKAVDPQVLAINPKVPVTCDTYMPGCLSVTTLQHKELEFVLVEFTTEAEAIQIAKKYRGYYFHNWMFDDVHGEPLLEKLITQGLEVKKP